ncbi:MAG TPA: phasin family protein [Sphingomonadaceae bacterium]
MADDSAKAASSAEQAYAAAAESAPAKGAAAEVKTPQAKVAAAKPKPTPTGTAPAKAPARPIKTPIPEPKQVSQTKEPAMAQQADFTNTVTDAVAEFQTRAKAAYDKSAAVAGEATEFAKGNVEALVEAGKIYSENLQNLGKVYAEDAKAAFETLTADLKEFAAVKTPTELFQLQSRLMRRNFDSLVAFGSKSSEAAVKIANETLAPISSRVSLAAEKFSKAA